MNTSQTNLHLGTALYRINVKVFEWRECGANSITKIEMIEVRVPGCFSFLHLDFLISCENFTFPSLLFQTTFYLLPPQTQLHFGLKGVGILVIHVVSLIWFAAQIHKQINWGFSELWCRECVGGWEWMAVAYLWWVWHSEKGNVELHHLFILWKCYALF